jgi:predicted Zn-dependent peptidase
VADNNVRRRELPGGLRVFSEPLSEATSVSLGVWIRAGSRDERDEVAGITHLMEHMLFKGTPTSTPWASPRPSRASAPRRTRRRARSTPCSTPASCPSTSKRRST